MYSTQTSHAPSTWMMCSTEVNPKLARSTEAGVIFEVSVKLNMSLCCAVLIAESGF